MAWCTSCGDVRVQPPGKCRACVAIEAEIEAERRERGMSLDDLMAMSEAEADAAMEAEEKLLDQELAALPPRPLEPDAVRRRRSTRRALGMLLRLRALKAPDVIIEYNQIRLLKLRTWRQTGVYPGEA